MKYKFPFLLTILAIIGSVFIGILFGANESLFKNHVAQGIEKNVKIQSITDPQAKTQKIKAEQDKNWRYIQRYHFHAGGVAALSLGILILLAFIETSKKEFLVASYSVALGGFLYPFVWLFAGLYGPEMGREEAKEAFRFLGFSGGIYLIGVIYSLYLAAVKSWKEPLDFAELED